MQENMQTNARTIRWKRFSHKAYAVFFSLKREVNIGVLSVATTVTAGLGTASAQTTAAADTAFLLKEHTLEEVEVTASRVPLTELRAARMVTVLSRADVAAAAVHSINDLLKYAAGVDVRQRGGFGIQTDISVRGGTFDQVTILLNGVNITSPQTGHHSAAFPVSMNDIERIEILEGPAARVFGTSAFTGAINIVTRGKDKPNQASGNVMAGAYGLFSAGAGATYGHDRWSNNVSIGFDRADGATPNSDFRNTRAYYGGSYSHEQADVHWQMGVYDRAFGANTFYSAGYPNQYEEQRSYTVSVQAQTKGWLKIMPTVYWNRMHDHFQLIRNTPTGENFHLNDVYGTNLNMHFNTALGKTAFGAELRNEGILSTKLGKPLDEDQYVPVPGEKEVKFTNKDNRTNVSYYAEHNFLFPRWTISVGVMANMNTALDHKYRLYPGVDISWRPAPGWKLFASCNKALRMPTFTDLYYESPNIMGNIGLKPEKTTAVSVGGSYANAYLRTSVSGFYNKGKGMIDWVKYTADDKFHSTNFELDNMGVEASATIDFDALCSTRTLPQRLSVSYAYIHQNRHDDRQIYKSNYALEYLRHKLVVKFEHRIVGGLSASWALRAQNRRGSYEVYEVNAETGKPENTHRLTPYPTYALVDLKLCQTLKNYQLFVEANNLFDKQYHDLGNIPQPGLWVRAGFSCKFNY